MFSVQISKEIVPRKDMAPHTFSFEEYRLDLENL